MSTRKNEASCGSNSELSPGRQTAISWPAKESPSATTAAGRARINSVLHESFM